ncbi:hypothetical protein BGZ94_001698 [Podila epigama]|nr:hypothetical protein BGZ94_001698 [Podila epigama]
MAFYNNDLLDDSDDEEEQLLRAALERKQQQKLARQQYRRQQELAEQQRVEALLRQQAYEQAYLQRQRRAQAIAQAKYEAEQEAIRKYKEQQRLKELQRRQALEQRERQQKAALEAAILRRLQEEKEYEQQQKRAVAIAEAKKKEQLRLQQQKLQQQQQQQQLVFQSGDNDNDALTELFSTLLFPFLMPQKAAEQVNTSKSLQQEEKQLLESKESKESKESEEIKKANAAKAAKAQAMANAKKEKAMQAKQAKEQESQQVKKQEQSKSHIDSDDQDMAGQYFLVHPDIKSLVENLLGGSIEVVSKAKKPASTAAAAPSKTTASSTRSTDADKATTDANKATTSSPSSTHSSPELRAADILKKREQRQHEATNTVEGKHSQLNKIESTLDDLSRELEQVLVGTIKNKKHILMTEENLTKVMFKIDSVESEGDLSIRKRRKELIKRSQTMLDRVDEFKSRALNKVEGEEKEKASTTTATSTPSSPKSEPEATKTEEDQAANDDDHADLESLSDIESLPEVQTEKEDIDTTTESAEVKSSEATETEESAEPVKPVELEEHPESAVPFSEKNDEVPSVPTENDNKKEQEQESKENQESETKTPSSAVDPFEMMVEAALQLVNAVDNDFELVSAGKSQVKVKTMALLILAQSETPTSIARRAHSGTLIDDTIYFVGGQDSALATAKPLGSMSSLNLTTLTFSELEISSPIYSHAATTDRIDRTLTIDNRIGLAFGRTSAAFAAPALQWLDPNTGKLSVPPSNKAPGRGAGGNAPAAPATRVGHSLVQSGNMFWAFGGRGGDVGNTVADSPAYNNADNTWSTKAKGLARYGHASAKLDMDRVLSCFGVSTTSSGLDSDCVVYTISTSATTPISLTWKVPEDAIKGGRTGVTLVPGESNTLYMFGGMSLDGNEFYQDVYVLNTTQASTVIISKAVQSGIVPSTNIPSPRTDHVAVAVRVGGEMEFMIVHGGSGPKGVMANGSPYFFRMSTKSWVNADEFRSIYKLKNPDEQVSVAHILIGIVAGVSFLGCCVAFYIWKGLRDDRLKKEAEGAAHSPTLSNADSPRDEHGDSNKAERKGSIYPSTALVGNDSHEDHSMAPGPFKSTTSLLQSEDYGKSKKKGSKPWVNSDPYSPGGTTLTESLNGYSSSSSSAGHRGNRNNGDTRNHGNAGTGGSSIQSGQQGTHEPYYNPRDLFLDTEDDDSSINASLVSESTLSPWAGPVRMSSDLAPPNPRFSRGAMSQAHRQLVRGSGGWDTSSPGGSLSSRDDSEGHRRSVNSMQWVSFEPFDPSRPESMLFDPHAGRSNLTVRNTSSYYGNSNAQRFSMYGGSVSGGNTSDGTDDSYGQGGRRISAALAARQQRRSFRNSQESFKGQGNAASSNLDANGDAFVTKVLPIITSKVTKPSMAKVVNHRGSRVVVPNSGPLGQHHSGDGREDEQQGSLGIDLESIGSLPTFDSNYSTNNSGSGNMNGRLGYPQGRRTSSTLNPDYRTQPKKESRLTNSTTRRDSTNVILRMPPPPKHPSGLRDSIAELGQDVSAIISYGEGPKS